MPFIGNIGAPELIIILVIALLVLGPGKLPEVGSALGKGIREFRKAASDVKDAASIEPVGTASADAPVPPTAVASAPAAVASPPAAVAPPLAATSPAAAPSGPETPAS